MVSVFGHRPQSICVNIFDSISGDAKSFLRRLTDPDPDRRLTAASARRGSWRSLALWWAVGGGAMHSVGSDIFVCRISLL